MDEIIKFGKDWKKTLEFYSLLMGEYKEALGKGSPEAKKTAEFFEREIGNSKKPENLTNLFVKALREQIEKSEPNAKEKLRSFIDEIDRLYSEVILEEVNLLCDELGGRYKPPELEDSFMYG